MRTHAYARICTHSNANSHELQRDFLAMPANRVISSIVLVCSALSADKHGRAQEDQISNTRTQSHTRYLHSDVLAMHANLRQALSERFNGNCRFDRYFLELFSQPLVSVEKSEPARNPAIMIHALLLAQRCCILRTSIAENNQRNAIRHFTKIRGK